MERSTPIRVFTATHNRIFALGINRLLESSALPMQAVGCRPADPAALHEIQRQRPDVVVTDAEIQVQTADFPLHLNSHKIGLLVMSSNRDLTEMETMMRSGAQGVVHLGETEEILLGAIEQVARARLWMPDDLSERMLRRAIGGIHGPRHSPEEARIAQLTKRERQLIGTLAKHPEAKSFALGALMNNSESTIRNHLSAIYRKLGVRGKAALILFAKRHHLA